MGTGRRGRKQPAAFGGGGPRSQHDLGEVGGWYCAGLIIMQLMVKKKEKYR